jgi:hypothetical protein
MRRKVRVNLSSRRKKQQLKELYNNHHKTPTHIIMRQEPQV